MINRLNENELKRYEQESFKKLYYLTLRTYRVDDWTVTSRTYTRSGLVMLLQRP